jgi:signal transduction histidine kinase
MPVPARCDRKLVLRVIANLVDNAVKFSPPEGTVSVLATTTERGATVKVFDAGPGIPPEARSMIFDKFGQVRGVQQSSRSSGLGLTFCKLAVEAHGGVIGVESDGRTGSEFWFSIPPRGFE